MAKVRPPPADSVPIEPPVERRVRYLYMGRRVTKSDRLGYFWVEANADFDTGHGYLKQIAPAQIGECWELSYKQGETYYVGGPNGPKQVTDFKRASRRQLDEWIAEDAAALQRDIERKANAQLAKRKGEFERAIEPLRRMANALQYHDSRAAFIARVTAELWKRA